MTTTPSTDSHQSYGAAGAIAVGGITGERSIPVAVGASLMGLFASSSIWVFLVANFAGGALAAVLLLCGTFAT